MYEDSIDQSQQSYTGPVEIFGNGGLNEEQAQGFKPSENIICPRVDLYLGKISSPTDNITATIETNASCPGGPCPSGTLVHANATKALAASGVPGNDWITFTFPSTFSLTGGVQYHIVLKRSGSRDTSNYIWWGYESGNPYADGMRNAKDNGSWSDNPDDDLEFKLYKRIFSVNALFSGANF